MQNRLVIRIGAIVLLCCTVVPALWFVARSRELSHSSLTLRTAALEIEAGRYERARGTTAWLLWFEPQHADALRLKGLSYLKQKEYTLAASCLAAVPASARSHRQASRECVAAFLADYQMQNAEASLRRHLGIYPEDGDMRSQLFGLLMAQLRQDDACQLMLDDMRRPAFRSLPVERRLETLRQLAMAEFDPPVAESCVSLLLQSHQRHSTQRTVLCALGRCYWKSGQLKQAHEFLQRADLLAPHDKQTSLLYAEFLVEYGTTDEAAQMLQRWEQTAAREPAAAQWQFVQSRLFERSGNLAAALNSGFQVLQVAHDRKHVQSHVARLLQKSGRTAEAQELYERAHHLAENELALWKLTRSLTEHPCVDDCSRVSTLYAGLTRVPQADAWQQIADTLPQKMSEESPAAVSVSGPATHRNNSDWR